MGIFSNKSKNQITNNQIKKQEWTVQNGKKAISIFGIKEETPVAHSNNTRTLLQVGRIDEYTPGDCRIFDAADYIAFELPVNWEINKPTIHALVQAYLKERDHRDRKECVYIGSLHQNQRGAYEFGNKSQAVENFVKNTLSQKIRSQIEQKNKEREKRQSQRNREQFQKNQSTSNYEQESIELRQQRLKNPSITFLEEYENEGKKYQNYDGINIRTGDILRIRKLNKVGKDTEGNYLYTGYINNTFNQHDVEMIAKQGVPMGMPICFEIPKRYTDVIRSEDQAQINQLLQLLSIPQNSKEESVIEYVGRIERNGQITRQEPLEAMKPTIERLKEEFKKQRER